MDLNQSCINRVTGNGICATVKMIVVSLLEIPAGSLTFFLAIMSLKTFVTLSIFAIVFSFSAVASVAASLTPLGSGSVSLAEQSSGSHYILSEASPELLTNELYRPADSTGSVLWAAASAGSLGQAIRMAKRQYPGRVLSAKTRINRRGDAVYRIKILSQSGEIRTIVIPSSASSQKKHRT